MPWRRAWWPAPPRARALALPGRCGGGQRPEPRGLVARGEPSVDEQLAHLRVEGHRVERLPRPLDARGAELPGVPRGQVGPLHRLALPVLRRTELARTSSPPDTRRSCSSRRTCPAASNRSRVDAPSWLIAQAPRVGLRRAATSPPAPAHPPRGSSWPVRDALRRSCRDRRDQLVELGLETLPRCVVCHRRHATYRVTTARPSALRRAASITSSTATPSAAVHGRRPRPAQGLPEARVEALVGTGLGRDRPSTAGRRGRCSACPSSPPAPRPTRVRRAAARRAAPPPVGRGRSFT